jgi:hypothetical protein
MNSERFTVVGFYTPEYEDCVVQFVSVAENLNLSVVVERMESRWDWTANTRLKPGALLQLRQKVQGILLYLDIDTLLLRVPRIPEQPWDVAVADNPVKTHVNRLTAGAFFLADTDAARLFLMEWHRLCMLGGGKDHNHFSTAVMNPMAYRVARADFAGCMKVNGLRPEREQAIS